MDPRRPLLERLERHRASPFFVPEERESLERLVAFVAARPRCFERASLDGHVTGSAWVVDADGGRVILLHHKKLGLWLQPGGHADGDPDVARVARAEAVEETGIFALEPLGDGIFDVDVHAIPARRHEPAHFHYDVRFAFRAPAGAQPVLSEESHEVAWVPLDRVPAYTRDRSVLRMLAKHPALSRGRTAAR
jgi:8-oxo-dGTP pyrophosphatase MutT (NUDIX family)